MHPSSDSSELHAARPFLRVVLAIVLITAGSAGVLVTTGSPVGLLVLGLAVVAGPVGVVAEARSRAARRAGAGPVARVRPGSHAEV